MSRSTQQLKELTAGVHLVILDGFTAVKNPDGSLKESETGEKLIQVRFTDGFNKSFDKQYWVKGEREHEFNKMISCAGIDRAKYETFKDLAKAATGNRIWLCIKEVYEIDGEDMIVDENGPIVSYQIFDYEPCINPEKKPIKKGNPQDHPKGVASGDFISYKQINKSLIGSPTPSTNTKTTTVVRDGSIKEDLVNLIYPDTKQMDDIWEATKPKEEPKVDKKEIIAKAKEMIAKVESKVKEPKKSDDTINWDDYK